MATLQASGSQQHCLQVGGLLADSASHGVRGCCCCVTCVCHRDEVLPACLVRPCSLHATRAYISCVQVSSRCPLCASLVVLTPSLPACQPSVCSPQVHTVVVVGTSPKLSVTAVSALSQSPLSVPPAGLALGLLCVVAYSCCTSGFSTLHLCAWPTPWPAAPRGLLPPAPRCAGRSACTVS